MRKWYEKIKNDTDQTLLLRYKLRSKKYGELNQKRINKERKEKWVQYIGNVSWLIISLTHKMLGN